MPLPALVDDQLLDALQAELTVHLGYDNLLANADERGAQDQQREETTGPGSPAATLAKPSMRRVTRPSIAMVTFVTLPSRLLQHLIRCTALGAIW